MFPEVPVEITVRFKVPAGIFFTGNLSSNSYLQGNFGTPILLHVFY
jgi:hypothetical protein